MSDPREDLRSTEESIRSDRDAIRSLENERAALTAGDPNVARLTERIDGFARRIRAMWAAEGDLLAELRAFPRRHDDRAAIPKRTGTSGRATRD